MTGLQLISLLALMVVASACGSAHAGATRVAAQVATNSLAQSDCSGEFVAADLDHVTRGTGDSTGTFDGTGAGVAVGDLDGDGRDDIVLANLSGHTTIQHNRGDLEFTSIPLLDARTRQPAILDVDGDGDNDIVLTTGLGRPVFFRNQTATVSLEADAFSREELPGVAAATYSMAWADLGGDGDLDLVTGSYNAELTFNQRHQQLLGSAVGAVRHERGGEEFTAAPLTNLAQALAVHTADINGDGLTDILVGNDLATPDELYVATEDGDYRLEQPFSETSYSTMSLDTADVDNDGDLEVFSTDMHPMDDAPATREAYAPIVEEMAAMPLPDDIQHPVNVLQMAGEDGFDEVARDVGIHATGWSWSGVFGDLDNDGLQDLYVVNGMVSDALFGDRDGAALVERNQAFRSHGGGFVPAPEWSLDDPAQGRGLVMADLDRDGDLDIVVNNLLEPSRIYENQICQGAGLLIDLEWVDSRNTTALGATITVHGEGGAFTRTVESSRGYLSGPSTTVHVGLGDSSQPVEIEVRWPDGAVSEVEDVPVDHLVTVTRT
ncbi:CRTAC1 family protein [Euzebya tangerina]|uniref:CRTAC1 family protein n=1 Tax=Euzebya tangerina TaxID=591198 RepID=UPI0013C353D8|nr:CRTAC1 family protein [Euzebya tangerina]